MFKRPKYRIIECFTGALGYHYIIQERYLYFWWKPYYAGEFEFSSPSIYGAMQKLKQIQEAKEHKQMQRVVFECDGNFTSRDIS